jgi:protein-disulfide isomerase
MAAKKTTAREAARIRKGGFTAEERAKLKKDLPTKEGMDYIKKNLKTGPGMKVTNPRSKSGASTVAAVAKRFGVTAREARDIAKAIGNVAESAVASKNIKNPQQQYLGGKALKASVKDLKKQVKETGRAAKSGTTGTRAGKLSYNIDTGSPQGLKGKERPKYRGSLTQY